MAVAEMSAKPPSVGFDTMVEGPGRHTAQVSFGLREDEVKRVEVKRIRRQRPSRAASRLDRRPRRCILMHAQAVEHEHPLGGHGRQQVIGQPVSEEPSIEGAIREQQLGDAL